ncbi:unnamed protein product [Dovyalis caffra]|uniref:Uncharacterized protein n=1 Tax=Dovyalis caffra TaxID=77055 RepID=A0AAV1S6A8_9ROSI|nr:unnamed protein product [Dovyalis caffra]
MGFTKDQLLARLKELQIDFSQYEHPTVLTVEAQAKYVGDKGGGLSKNLFLKRLGLGKGGIRMAPEEALGEILQFLKSIGRDPSYVDLEANPTVGKDQPPDLAAFVPSGSTVLPDQPDKAAPLQDPTENSIPVNKKSVAATVKATKPHTVAQNSKDKSVNPVHQPRVFSDAGLFVEEILNKTSALLLSEITEEAVKENGVNLGTVVADNIRKRLNSDLQSIAMMFKNTAYTQGFHAGAHQKIYGETTKVIEVQINLRITSEAVRELNFVAIFKLSTWNS